MIIELELAPGDVLREDELRSQLGFGRTPIREAIQRLARDQFVTVVPRRGVFVTGLDVSELSMLYETRAVLEPYAARLAATRGSDVHWREMEEALRSGQAESTGKQLLRVDRRCHEIMWDAASNRFLVDTLDMLYAQSDRLWHMYLANDIDMSHPLQQHQEILDALQAGHADAAAELVELHVREFDQKVRNAVADRLQPVLPVSGIMAQ